MEHGGHYHSQSPEAFFCHVPGIKVRYHYGSHFDLVKIAEGLWRKQKVMKLRKRDFTQIDLYIHIHSWAFLLKGSLKWSTHIRMTHHTFVYFCLHWHRARFTTWQFDYWIRYTDYFLFSLKTRLVIYCLRYDPRRWLYACFATATVSRAC